MYKTYTFAGCWFSYQYRTPPHLHSQYHYQAWCKELVKEYNSDIMVLMDNVIKVLGFTWSAGRPTTRNAEIDGYIDIRTGKKYPTEQSIFFDIGK
jgi:hypothetical protein